MKFIHLSDLHIGKRVNEFSMTEDQRYILAQILSIVDREGANGIIIAGDIYDKPIPSAEAVQIFDGFLSKLAERKLPVFVVSGNHDSPERLAFGSQLMSSSDVYLSPVYEGEVKMIQLSDSYGEICIYLLPFIKPATVRHVFENEEITTYQDAVTTAIEHMDIDTAKRNILVAHQFVTGAGRCESEEAAVGGLDQVNAEVFESFDYVALGHIHSPQCIGRETVRYCGTPLKYSFSEAWQEKSVTLVEMKEKGHITISGISLTPLRDMRTIRGTYLEVTKQSFYEGTNTEDYMQVILTDEEDVVDGLQKLRVIYPNLMRLEYDNKRTRESHLVEGMKTERQKSELELFEEFYELQNNQSMKEPQKKFAEKLIQEIKERMA